VGLHGVTSPDSKPALAWAPLFTGPARSLLQHGLPTGSQLPSGFHLLQHRVPSVGYRCISAPPWTSTDCRGTTCLTMVFITSCKGKPSTLAPQAPPPPLSSLILVSAEFFLSHSLTPLSQLLFHHRCFPPLKYVITEVLPLLLIGLVLASNRSVLELASIVYQTWGKLLKTSHRIHPYSPPHYQNLATQSHNRHS